MGTVLQMTLKVQCDRCGMRDDTDRKNLHAGDKVLGHDCDNPFCIKFYRNGTGVVVEE